jgi:predicted aldo/keto reductase-like oxidoreductase
MMKRRNFITSATLGGFALTLPAIRAFGNDFPGDFQLPQRVLGKTGEKLSVIGFGGIMLNDNPQDFADEIIAKAWDLGVNYYDVAPGYGTAEERMGPALRNYRKKAFLACKTQERSREGAEKTLVRSLQRLETDWFDLFQLHALSSVEEVEKAFGPGGAMEIIDKAKKEGKIRFVGFSAHSVDAALLAMQKYEFDTVMFPLNFACWHAGDFGPQIYAKAVEKNMGVLALKAMALTGLAQGEPKYYKNMWYKPVDGDDLMKLALQFTLSKKITAAIPPGKGELFLKAIALVKDFRPNTAEENGKLLHLAADTKPLFRHG